VDVRRGERDHGVDVVALRGGDEATDDVELPG
jgi:hypothetical protein